MKKLKNWVNSFDRSEYPQEGILSKKLEFKNKKAGFQATLFYMVAGEKISEHTSTKEGLIYVLDGEGFFNLEGERIKMLPGIFINMKNNAIHSLEVEKNTSFLLILFN